MTQSDKKTAVHIAATLLLKANNTVTTLEIKEALRISVGGKWYQTSANPDGEIGVSEIMQELASEGKFDYVDNGTFRVYSGKPVSQVAVQATAPAVNPTPSAPKAKKSKEKAKTLFGLKITGKVQTISRTAAYKAMSNNKGHFFTAVFTAKDGSERLMNCQYLKDQTGVDLGYVKVKEASLIREAAKATKFNGKGEPLDEQNKPIRVIRNVNLQTLKAIKIGGNLYKIR